MRLRVGVVGLGGAWRDRHRPALMALSDRFDVRAVCAEVAVRAEQVASEFGACPVDGFRALTKREDIDAVLVLAPEWYGLLPVLAACESGKAVYCAAALDMETERAEEIKLRVERSGVAFMAEFPRRHAPATLRLKELIATRLGQPRLLFCHERQRAAKGNNVCGRRPQKPALRSLMESVDWCRYVVGDEPTSVVGIHHQMGSNGVDDYDMLSLDFSPPHQVGTGPLAQISYSRYLRADWHEAVSFRPPAEMQVCCQNGVAFVDLPSTITWFDEAGRHHESLGGERPVGEQLLMHFHRAVTSLVRKTGDLEDAYRALHVVLASECSIRSGRREMLNL